MGGILCCLVALAVAPAYWWLGIFAGLAGGYLAYEFRAVCDVAKVALIIVAQETGQNWRNWFARAKEWLLAPHPFLYGGILLGGLTTLLLRSRILAFAHAGAAKEAYVEGIFHVFVATVLIFLAVVYYMMLFIMACNGAELVERRHFLKGWSSSSLGYMPLTYRNAIRWVAKGVLVTSRFIFWTIWKERVCFIARFHWTLFKRIHSEKRVLCAIDGTLGGVLSYLYLSSGATALPEKLLLIIFGGLLGAVFGVVDFELVSKRILRVVPASIE